jgi:arabinogalactan oligomer/maltooligosaccharide transport system permease protein
MPMSIAVAVLTFMATYSDFIIARVIIQTMDKLTVIVGLNLFTTIRFDVDFGMLTAGAIVAALPIILIYIPLQRYIIGGITAGAVRG